MHGQSFDFGYIGFRGDLLRIKRASPSIADLLLETGIRDVRIAKSWDADSLEVLRPAAQQLERVEVSANVSDLSLLGECSELRKLFIRSGFESIDLSALSKLESFSAEDISALRRLSVCPNLRELRLSDCELHDLEELRELVRLRTLMVISAPLARLDGIEALGSLSEFSVQQAPLVTLAGLEHARQLEWVGLAFLRKLESVAELGMLPALRSLGIMSAKKIRDLECIGDAKQLERLRLESVPIGDPAFLAALVGLRELQLVSVGRLPSLSFLSGMQHLEIFMPAENTVIEDGDMSILLRLPALKQILYSDRRHYSPRYDDIETALEARSGGMPSPKSPR